MPGVAHAVCDGFAGGEPLDTCSRQVLKRQVARLRERLATLHGSAGTLDLIAASAGGTSASVVFPLKSAPNP